VASTAGRPSSRAVIRPGGPSPKRALSIVENRLIELLPRRDRARLIAIGEPVELVLSDVLCQPGEATRHVYFPIEGFISLLTLTDADSALEVGMVGRECAPGAGRGDHIAARARPGAG
jgi:hypothetical protein